GTTTGLKTPQSIALDPANNEFFVGNTGVFPNDINIFSRTASGAAPPIRTLNGDTTGTRLSGPTSLALRGAPVPPPPPTTVVAAVLPNARAIQVGGPVTVNATIINAGTATAVQAGISLATAVPTSFGYWLLDTSVSPPTLVGAPNTP